MANQITIHLHIGAGKTGSTSIQHMLRVMATDLLDNGYLVFNNQFEPHASADHNCEQQTYFNELIQQGEAGRTKFAQRMHRNLAYMRNHNISHAIISAECLMNYWNNFSHYFDEFINEVDWQIIAYVRNQPEFLLSSWKQWSHFINTNFDNWLHTNMGTWGNWPHHLAEWENMFGTEHISLGILDKRFMVNSDLLADFIQRIGCAPLSFSDELRRNVNTSPNNHALQAFEYLRDNDYIRTIRSKYYADPDQGSDFDEYTRYMRRTMTDTLPSYKNLIIRNAKHHGMRANTPALSYFTQSQLDKIYTAYHESNKQLLTRYRPEITVDLAFPKIHVTQTVHLNDQQMSRYVDQLLFEMVNTIDNRHQYMDKQIKRIQKQSDAYVTRSEYVQLEQRIVQLEAQLSTTWGQRLRQFWNLVWARHQP